MEKVKAGYIEGIVSIVINTALFALKLWAGIITGSLALTADAWHTLSDSITSVVVVIAVKLSSRKPDKEHPFGHGRWEQIASLFIAFFLGIIAFDFLKNSAIQFINRKTTLFGTLAVVVTVVSIVVKELLAQYAFYTGRKTGNISVKADGWHHRTDALSSLIVLAGILFAKQCWWLDSVLGAAVSLMLFYAAYKIIRETITKLLGEEPGQELIDKITEAVIPVFGDGLRLHHFHLHNYVAHKELTLHIRLNKDLTIEKGHQIATGIENIIGERFGIITTIHIEPLVPARD
ncbi:MAG: cation diffusion facilitator family transporter [Treponema sp.]|jgi:cation diffusion facilitator family transporter|nr:cation diffusion facilitator family transporter [Treponema sp.]